ncbi:ABC transporter substrate-binding protein [Cohnella sp. WQ 127256]|uniref:ABC transporter substrate-binding protein n=1 Tax=Cohnella sp. WQ 127256 TaxID=2938790 RepID=UPI002117676C|nr:extracellular solute-binding protein [Cohnella sp. WQ 127256]
MRRRISAIGSVLLATSVLIAGCGNSTNKENTAAPSAAATSSNSATASDSGEKITLRLTIWGSSPMTIGKNDAVIKKFEELHPNINIESENYSSDVYNDKLGVMAASSNLPDIIRIDYSAIQNYATKDLLLPLEPFVADKTINLDGIDPANTDSGKINGVLYGLNIGNNAPVMFYNPKLLEQSGIAAPTPDYSWEQYEKDMETLKGKGLIGDTHMGMEIFTVWLRQQGSKLYSEDGVKLGYEDDKLFSDYFDMQLRWQEKGIISPLGTELEIKGLEDGPYAKGQSGFGAGLGFWSNQADVFVKSLGGPIGYAMYPGSGDGKGMYIKPSFFHSIAKNSKHPKEAAQFIEFYTNSLEAARELNGYFGMPYKQEVIAGMQDILTDTQKSIIAYMDTVRQHSSKIDNPEPTGHTEIKKLFKNVSDEIFFEKISPADGAKKFRDLANTVLAKSS